MKKVYLDEWEGMECFVVDDQTVNKYNMSYAGCWKSVDNKSYALYFAGSGVSEMAFVIPI